MAIGNVIDHTNDSSTMLSPQISEESFNHEAFNNSDGDDELTPDLYSTVAVNETSPPQVSALQDDLSLLDHSLQPDANPTLIDGPSPATSIFSDNPNDETPILGEYDSNHLDQADISEANGLINLNSPQNDLSKSATTFPPNTHTAATTSARDGPTHIHSEDADTTQLQPIRDEPITPTTTFCSTEASTYGSDESEPIDPLDSRSADGLEGDSTFLQNDSVLAGPNLPAHRRSTPDTRSSSPTLSYLDEEDSDAATQLPLDNIVPIPDIPPDLDMPLQQDRLPVIATHSSLTTEHPSQSISDSLEGSPLEISLTLSLDYPETLIDSQVLTTDDEAALESPSEPTAVLSESLSSSGYPLPDLPPFPEFLLPDLKPYDPMSDARFDVGEGQYISKPVDILYITPLLSESNGQISSPQPSPSSSACFLEPSPVLLPTRPHSVNADIQSAAASTEDPVVEVSSNLSPSPPRNSARQEGHLGHDSDTVPPLDLQCLQDIDERSNIDTNILASSTHGSAITFTLPPIPATPSGSPILDGLSQYMTLHDLDAPGVVSQENSSVDLDEVSAIECTSMSGNGQSLRSGCSEPQPTSNPLDPSPDLLCPHHISHVQFRDSYLGMSTRGPSPFQRIQLGLLNVIPSIFALNRETVNRATSCSSTSPRL